ncbi:MAG: hypothetical protein FWF00_00565 [Endomicrobia bacterium]|nr:hypothetical protein [Endomicrobiia bacterium]
MKKIIIIFCVLIIFAVLAVNRMKYIAEENAREVFNIARAEKIDGVPVETMIAKVETGFLRSPAAVRNGRILVAGNRINQFRVGQRLSGGGRINSIPGRVDLDTGLFAITTNSRSGNFFVEMEHRGVFVPLSAIENSAIMLSENGIATTKRIAVVATDIERAVVRGLAAGDVIILTRIEPGTKIRDVTR